MRGHRVLLRALVPYCVALGMLLPAVGQDIVLGQIVNKSGDQSDSCDDFLAGAQTYLTGMSSRGGLNGDKVVVVQKSEGATPAETIQIAKNLVDKDKAVALFGFCGGNAARVIVESGWFRQGGIAMMAPVSGAQALRGNSVGEVYHVRAGTTDEARKIATNLVGFGMQKVAILSTREEFGTVGRVALEEAVRGAGLSLVANIVAQSDTAGMAQAAKQLAASPAQAVLLSMSTLPAAMFIGEVRKEQQGKMIFALSDVNHVTLGDFIGSRDAAQGVVIAALTPSPYFAVSPIAREHIKAMQQFRSEPPTHATLEGYMAAKLMFEALKKAGRAPTPQAVAKALAQVGTVDLGGHVITLARGKSGSSFVEMTVVAKNGSLLN